MNASAPAIVWRGPRGRAGAETAPASTSFERLLVAALAALLPLDDHLPVVAGFGTLYLCFAGLALYVGLVRSARLWEVCWRPVFLAAYVFFILAFAIESLHPTPDYGTILRLGQMIAGGILLAALCRDQAALYACFIGCIAASLWLSLLLFGTSYGALSMASAGDYHQASQVRATVSEFIPLEANLNAMAFFAAQGSGLALAFALTARRLVRRVVFLGVSIACLIGSFLPMSRGGIVIAGASCLIAVAGAKILKPSTVLAGAFVGLLVFAAAPRVVFVRMTTSQSDGRSHVFNAAMRTFPEYALTGVGAGNFWGRWGLLRGFKKEGSSVGVLGTHNSFLQAWINWGIVGLLALAGVVVTAWRQLPRVRGPGPERTLAICVRIVAVSLFLWLALTHTVYDKQFSLGLGVFAVAGSLSRSAARRSARVVQAPAVHGAG